MIVMNNLPDILRFLRSTEAANKFTELYGKREGVLLYQMERYCRIAKRFFEEFGTVEGVRFFSAPGRTEIGGNHTDHQAGRVLAAGVNLDTVAIAAPTDNGVITVYSEGYDGALVVDTAALDKVESEKETSMALIRGVAARFTQLGHKVGGFNAIVTSSVFKGSGLSSSAAFEVLMADILSGLYNDGKLTGLEMAQISQYAENEYFGKPSGLMDQAASALGGLVTIDFRKADPKVENVDFDFASKGYALVVVGAGGNHADLTAEYAAIPTEMKQVAAEFGGKVLREVLPEQVEEGIAALRGKVSDRAILRALHFFDENQRVGEQVDALKKGDIDEFFRLIIASGESSWKLLQNVYVAGSTEEPLALALEMSRRMLEGKGAWRIHGGGFAGTILTFVPNDMLKTFTRKMEDVFGAHSCTVLDIRHAGAIEWKI